MHETCIRIQEQHEFERFANYLQNKIAIFYFLRRSFIREITAVISLMTLLMHETCIRIQEQHEFARIANNLEKKNANFYFLHRSFI